MKMNISQVENLESRTHFAFGDLDTTWGKNGVLTLTGSDHLAGISQQKNGQLIISLYANDDHTYIIKRRTLTGALDKHFASAGQITPFARYSEYSVYSDKLLVLGDDSIAVSYKLSEGNETFAESFYIFDRNGLNQFTPAFATSRLYSNLQETQNGDLIAHRSFADDDSNNTIQWSCKTRQVVNGSQSSLWTLEDGTFLKPVYDEFRNLQIFRVGSDMKTPLNFGKAKSFTRENSWSYYKQPGKYLLAASEDFYSGIFSYTRIDTTTGLPDTNFGRGSSGSETGIINVPQSYNVNYQDVNMLADGRIVYGRLNQDGKVVIGIINADGSASKTSNTPWNATERTYNIIGSFENGLFVGNDGAVYFTIISDTSEGGYVENIIKFEMPASPIGKITGKLFNDINSNGRQDRGESVIAGRTVFIDTNHNNIFDTGEWSVLTDTDGKYTIDGLATGMYNIRRVLPAGYKVTNPLFSKGSITIKTGQTITANIGSVKV